MIKHVECELSECDVWNQFPEWFFVEYTKFIQRTKMIPKLISICFYNKDENITTYDENINSTFADILTDGITGDRCVIYTEPLLFKKII